jgi:putative pyruvate formate lyase activating enzyme
LSCQFCQNHDISQTDAGRGIEPEDLAMVMLDLQTQGCHNINFVSPSHVIPQILAGVLIAAQAGLEIPLVYNTGGYDTIESLRLLDGVIDIYMPDMKYANSEIAWRLSKVKDYPRFNQAAVAEMHRQVGDLLLDSSGIATQGLLVRHLILPQNLAGTDLIVKYLAEKISRNTYLNLMDQYRPSFRARKYSEIARPITREEYGAAIGMAQKAGITRLDRRQRRALW